MINLINEDDFLYPMVVAPNDNARLDGIISAYQPIILKKILGEIEYINFENDFTKVAPIILQTQKWIDFLNGTTYNLISPNGQNLIINYLGIKQILVNFIYFYYQKDIQSIASYSGEVRLTPENSTLTFADDRMASIWKNGIEKVGNNKNFNKEKYKPTAYNFLYNNKNDFPDWKFTNFKQLSIF